MITAYRTKLYKSVLDCGCNLGLGEFDEEAELEDVEAWVRERGYVLTPADQSSSSSSSESNDSRILRSTMS